VQADNTWRTVVAALAVGPLDGTLALISKHSTAAEFAAAVESRANSATASPPAVAGGA